MIIPEVKEVPIEQLSQREFNQARSKGELTVGKETEAEPEEKKEDKPKPKGGFQTRIDRLVRQNAELAEELDKVRAAKAPEKTETKPATVAEAEPKLEDFTDHNEYIKAMAKFIARQELRSEREAETKKEQEAQRKSEFDAYNERAIEAQAKYDDWKEVVGQNITIPPAVHVAIIEMENGPDVAYYLGKHPELAKELMEMSPSRANGKIWRISEDLAAEAGSDEEEEEPEEKAKPEIVPEKKKYEPIKPLGGGSTKSSVPLDKMDMKEYKKARAAGRTH